MVGPPIAFVSYGNPLIYVGTPAVVDADLRTFGKVKTQTGDLCFKSGQYSLESAYWDDVGYIASYADTWGQGGVSN